jgi:Meiotically up-regulated gene 113
MLRNYFNHLYYLSANEIIVDYLSVCLIEVLLEMGENPIKITLKQLAKIMKCEIPELEFSLNILKKKELINYELSYNPEELLLGTIQINLNYNQIQRIKEDNFSKPKIRNSSIGGFVYVINRENSQEYKIGKSKDIGKRILQLKTANSENLILVKSVFSLNYGEIEKNLHKKYRHYRISGEWFLLDENVLIDLMKTLSKYL